MGTWSFALSTSPAGFERCCLFPAPESVPTLMQVPLTPSLWVLPHLPSAGSSSIGPQHSRPWDPPPTYLRKSLLYVISWMVFKRDGFMKRLLLDSQVRVRGLGTSLCSLYSFFFFFLSLPEELPKQVWKSLGGGSWPPTSLRTPFPASLLGSGHHGSAMLSRAAWVTHSLLTESEASTL